MTTNISGVGQFTAENIVAVLLAIPDSDGTYADVAENARHQGATVGQHTVAKWITRGRKDMTARKNTAYARFAKQYEDWLKEHCGPERNRHRQLERALAILERACECGNEKYLEADGKLADQCRNCRDLDDARLRRRRPTPPQTVEAGSARTGPRE